MVSRLQVKFLCKECNEELGAQVEADAKRDPSIRGIAAFMTAEGEHRAAKVLKDPEVIGAWKRVQ